VKILSSRKEVRHLKKILNVQYGTVWYEFSKFDYLKSNIEMVIKNIKPGEFKNTRKDVSIYRS